TGSYGSTGGYGSTGSHGSHGGSYIVEQPVYSAAKQSVESGMLVVDVPADATVFVNGKQTTSTGSHRQFVSHGLNSGQTYSYDVRVEYTVDGETKVESKQVSLTAGDTQKLAFGNAPTEAQTAAVTTLKVRVPENARVTLAGVATKQTGAEREFVTSRLAEGETWSDYTVVVEFDLNGQTVTREQTIALTGGEVRELEFSAADQQLAARN